MKRQKDLQLIAYIGKYGCLFMCMVYWFFLCVKKSELTYDALNHLWMDAISEGLISGDENSDGDMDDANELLVLDKDGLLKLAKIPLRYVGSFSPDVTIVPGQYAIGEFYNEATKFTHFAALKFDKTVAYDPILDSNTVKNGKLKTIRIFS